MVGTSTSRAIGGGTARSRRRSIRVSGAAQVSHHLGIGIHGGQRLEVIVDEPAHDESLRGERRGRAKVHKQGPVTTRADTVGSNGRSPSKPSEIGTSALVARRGFSNLQEEGIQHLGGSVQRADVSRHHWEGRDPMPMAKCEDHDWLPITDAVLDLNG